jgi:hypothetical protein
VLSPVHALYIGWVCGSANRNGVPLEPLMDGAGDSIVVVVPPPPADWSPFAEDAGAMP